ncbi:lipoate-protein ligase A [Cryptococcus wingfieldii CBS 7118]|uniref:Putative lipoate-protein ligase A n=1 Tax=Cryptococcus wingfieldii CBS 7118 TaxID=1295528 RepID=A0A1E3JTJ5_9TREE|nr:lipoate-protein ligase A [Cryptococcus wingfieldii CBS 7118]ODO03447.1 lipoate-protein ligase A [Cryptococcus wingfieldii CBS 7118]
MSLYRTSIACARTPRVAPRWLHTSTSRLQQKQAQPQTPATDNIELTAPATYISESHDPWFNLSYEDWQVDINTPVDQPVLFLYRNFPCVVIGRNQNPWKESTPRKLRDEGLPLVRRRSGGGTVYHDMGNTNFSIMLPRLMFTRSHGALLVSRAIRERLGIEECGVNERNDHVSGSAYKIIQHRAYHHGTMLISSSLAELGKSLKSSSPNMETKGIASHRSPVTTLNHFIRDVTKPIHHDSFTSALTSEFAQVYATPSKPMSTHLVHKSGVKEEKVWKGYEELKSWGWQYGQTPEFTNKLEESFSWGDLSVSLTSRHALITSLTFHLSPPASHPSSPSAPEVAKIQAFLDALALDLIGKRYESLEGAEGAMGHEWEGEAWRNLGWEVMNWLRRTM